MGTAVTVDLAIDPENRDDFLLFINEIAPRTRSFGITRKQGRPPLQSPPCSSTGWPCP